MNIHEMFIRVYQIRVICINRSSGLVLLKLHCKYLATGASEVRGRDFGLETEAAVGVLFGLL